MPSPVGHLLAGAAVAWALTPGVGRPIAITAAVLAAAPDLDLLLPVQHRTFSHSVGAVAVVTIVAIAVTGQVTRLRASRFGGQALRASRFGGQAPHASRLGGRVVAVCGLAWASHLVMDWMGPDPVFPHGLQMFWPFSDRFFISGWDWFKPTARTGLFTRPTIVRNLTAIAYETAVLGPIVLALYLVRVKPAAGLAAQMARRDHPAE